MFNFVFIDRPRFGLFSQPMSNAIGDNNNYKHKERKLDEDGHVYVGPRNFYTKKAKRGKMDAALFGKPSYISIGDPFKMAAL